MRRPKIAIIATCYFAGSHADVGGTRLMAGYPWHGEGIAPRVEVASMYLEQLGDLQSGAPRPDIGLEIAARNGVPVYPTVAEALGCGEPGLAVDGVVIIGEHGDYEDNEFGQQIYPRRRLFDSAVSTMIAAGRTVPIFNDKHLAHSFGDAKTMYDTAARLGIPFGAGSSVPLAWRIPTGACWPFGRPMDAAVCVGYGPVERYGFHILEALQATVERRAGGERGVVAVRALTGDAAAGAVRDGTVDASLLDQALDSFDISPAEHRQALDSISEIFLLEYADGLKAAAVNCQEVIRNFGIAGRGKDDQLSYQIWLQPKPHSHFIFLVRQMESLMLNGSTSYPVERTLLTTGVLDAAMHSRHDGGTRHETPELAIGYRPLDDIPDTGIDERVPDPPAGTGTSGADAGSSSATAGEMRRTCMFC